MCRRKAAHEFVTARETSGLIEFEKDGGRVRLMQATRERGRDVIVYSASGAVLQIIQCKHHEERFSAPDLRRELVKLALYHHQDATILGEGPIDYELWCPKGLTEPAAVFLDTWPRRWTWEEADEAASQVIAEYASLRTLDWRSIGAQVIDAFKRIVRPRHLGGLEISSRVRTQLPIYESFFQGTVVVQRNDLRSELNEILSKGGIVQVTDGDVRHMLDRIQSFLQVAGDAKPGRTCRNSNR